MKVLDQGEEALHNCEPFKAIPYDGTREGMQLQCNDCGQNWAIRKRPVYGGWMAERVPSPRRAFRSALGL